MKTKWRPFKTKKISEWEYLIDCPMPRNHQVVLATLRGGHVVIVNCELSKGGRYYTVENLEWGYDIIAWMPLPEPYKEES